MHFLCKFVSSIGGSLIIRQQGWCEQAKYWVHIHQHTQTHQLTFTTYYCQNSNMRRALLGNKIVDHSDVLGTSPVGAALTTSSFSFWELVQLILEIYFVSWVISNWLYLLGVIKIHNTIILLNTLQCWKKCPTLSLWIGTVLQFLEDQTVTKHG